MGISGGIEVYLQYVELTSIVRHNCMGQNDTIHDQSYTKQSYN